MQQATNSFWKRYFILIIAVGLFLVISAALIGATLLESNDIARGTHARRLAGNERSATQVVLLELSQLDRDAKAGRPAQKSTLDNLKDRAELITDTIKVFREGGRLPGDTSSVPLQPGAGATGEMINVNSGVNAVWAPYAALISQVLKSGGADQAKLDRALSYGLQNNEKLFGLLNDRVNDSQEILEIANRRLRITQTVGAVMIALNFLFTALVAFRRLIAGDRAVTQSRKQTDDILATVKEGLFLVTSDFSIGSQMSNSLPQIMQRKVEPGMNLLEVMRTMVTPQTLEATRDYLGLLFGKRVKENLVASLNPLSEVPVSGGSDGRGQLQSRYLNFQFNRVQESEDTVYLLVTVSDASERVRLTNEISAAKTRTREEMEALLRVLSRESSEVRLFLHRVGVVLERVNDDLRQAAARRTGTDYSELVNAIFRDVHSLKSEAAALSLDMIEALAHNFEVDLINLRDRGAVEGSDMVKMTVHLDDMFECVATIRDFLDRMAGNRDVAAPQSLVSPSQRAVEGWNTLAERIAREQGKQVQLDLQLQAFDRLPGETLNALRTIGLQLLRNAVVHGIEPAAERQARAKPSVGTVSFRSEDVGSRQVELVVRDDGRGLDVARIRAALSASGRYGIDQLESLSDRDVIMKIFEPGVSTAEHSDRDAGHGIGMDLVMKQVRSLSGTIALSTKVGAYTEFRIRLPVTESKPVAAAGGAHAPALPAGPADFQLTF
ncbi:ATP-binding protein [Lysobacter capsici]|uniref:ATP-binding protein n=1 Tax=Lysobacter capsici TaxID=435897 RepID=UPI001C006932|nr:ATP-binding protein [Lysobacter capsici]QWF15940.1 Hpt domain-containing protein [Lysobacter capsici]